MTVDEYLARAADLRSKAAETKDASVREQLLLMANDWEEFAARARGPDMRTSEGRPES